MELKQEEMQLEFKFRLFLIPGSENETEYIFYVREYVDENIETSWIPAFSWVARYSKSNTIGHLEGHLENLISIKNGTNPDASGFFGDGGFEHDAAYLKQYHDKPIETKPFWGGGFMLIEDTIYWFEGVYGQKVPITKESLDSLIKAFEKAISVTV